MAISGLLDGIEAATATVGERAAPAVVRIGRGWGRGAGVLISERTVITNAHNLRGGETTVQLGDGRSVTGTVAGLDLDGDLAVVNVDIDGLVPIRWDEGAPAITPGKPVFAVTALGGGDSRITFGLISGVDRAFRGPRGRLITNAVEHTVPLGRGSSGSPIVDQDGRLLGINTHRLNDGFYLAVPADAELRRRVESLSRGESPQRPYLGVAIVPPHAARRMRAAVGLSEREGLLVRGVERESPAARAGISKGDLIISANGRTTAAVDDLFEALEAFTTEQPLELVIVRGNEEIAVHVTLEGAGSEGSA